MAISEYFQNFVDYLNNQAAKFVVTNNIEVAGKNEYHFPELHVNKSVLQFDMEENNDTIKCLSGKLKDCSFIVLDKVCPNGFDLGLLVFNGWKNKS